MKIIILIFIFNGILIMMCKNETINLDNKCERKYIDYYGEIFFCENLNLTNYSQDIEFISDRYYINGIHMLTCENCTIPKYLKNIFNQFKNLHEINLINCKIENVDVYILDSSTKFKKITLKNNSIKELYSFTFVGTAHRESSNIELYLTNNKIEYIQEYCFSSTYITRIDLKSNQLTTIKQKMFAGANSLISLDLSNNSIEIIEEDSFLLQGTLKFLYLSNNKLINIQKNTFNGLESLRNLDLSYNMIKFIDSSAFQSIKDLLHLFLDNNNLKKIEEKTFCNLRNLMEIQLNHNEIESIGKDSFMNSSSLLKLFLNNNKLKYFNDTELGYKPDNLDIFSSEVLLDLSMNLLESVYFGNSYNLKTLNLSSNNIKDLYYDTFEGLNLKTLILSSNKIENIQEYCFNSTYINEIDLKSNQLTAIKKKMFGGATSLFSLDLRNNSIESIEEDSFLDQGILQNLNLSHNKLIDIEKNTFNGLESLRNLDLSYNMIKFIDNSAFKNMNPSVKIMNLSSNNIKDLYYDTFEKLNLNTLILSNNKIEKFDTHVIYPMNNLRVLYIDGNQISEIDYEDPKFRVTEINLSYNKWNCKYLKNMIKFLNKHGTNYVINKIQANITKNVAGIGCTENDQQQEYKINYGQNVSQKTEGALENTNNCVYIDKLNKSFLNLSENIEHILKTITNTDPNQIIIILLICILIISLNVWIYVFYRNKLQIHFKRNITEIHSLIDIKDNI